MQGIPLKDSLASQSSISVFILFPLSLVKAGFCSWEPAGRRRMHLGFIAHKGLADTKSNCFQVIQKDLLPENACTPISLKCRASSNGKWIHHFKHIGMKLLNTFTKPRKRRVVLRTLSQKTRRSKATQRLAAGNLQASLLQSTFAWSQINVQGQQVPVRSRDTRLILQLPSRKGINTLKAKQILLLHLIWASQQSPWQTTPSHPEIPGPCRERLRRGRGGARRQHGRREHTGTGHLHCQVTRCKGGRSCLCRTNAVLATAGEEEGRIFFCKEIHRFQMRYSAKSFSGEEDKTSCPASSDSETLAGILTNQPFPSSSWTAPVSANWERSSASASLTPTISDVFKVLCLIYSGCFHYIWGLS